MAAKIGDYAIIGNTYTAALVNCIGSIDWLCLPRFDSPACFAALVGEPANGQWTLAPASPGFSSQRRYLGDTLILETEFKTPQGVVAVRDFMPTSQHIEEPHRVVRMVNGLSGRVDMHTILTCRFDYGRITPWIFEKEKAWQIIGGPDGIDLRGPTLWRQEDGTLTSRFTVEQGQALALTLTWYPSNENVTGADDPIDLFQRTKAWWDDWAGRCTAQNQARSLMMRSLLTLKALTFRPTGGIIAAPTTSLPEQIGNVRNWDYRYCWLRDSTFTLYSLLMSGYQDEAIRWRAWLERAIAGDPHDMQILYGLAGERRLWEFDIEWLRGFGDSRPVRIGNKAHAQFQLDVYGEVMDTLHVARQAGIAPDPIVWKIQKALLTFVENNWHKPDNGIWEVRGPRRHFTHSKVMAWVAVDRAVMAAEQFGLGGPVDRWRRLRDAIHADVLAHGFDSQRNTFVQYYGADELDASLLMIPLVGFLPPGDPRVVGTIKAIERELFEDGFVRRYSSSSEVDGLPGGEGVFLPCSFWLVDNLDLIGRRQDAENLFDRLLGLRNDVGLLSEEYGPSENRMLGNFPQAFSHVALINTVHNLYRRTGPAVHRRSKTRQPVEQGPVA